ncbi:hypothetical protein NESM_000353400 [Novymonas esmeraldas]|uniref:Uncharacterized protein n=1 Tax=Novymonas esmeraldas TaxID=1808958 RepID=A0AAW0ELV7_9TRYP
MVKKTDSHARVLRPGESIALSGKSSEFEIVLFRPRHHDRAEPGSDSTPDAEVTAGSPLRDSSPLDGVGHTTGGKTRTAASGNGNELGHGEKKRSGVGHTMLRPPALGPRDAVGVVETDETAASPLVSRATGGGGDQGTATGDFAAGAPLFFDTTACIFYDELAKLDYVATGRTTADSKGLHYKPHLVVLGTEAAPGGYCNFNITRPDGESLGDGVDDVFEDDADVLVSRTSASNGPVTMAAADGIEVSLRRLSVCSGFLVSSTLFSKDTCLNRERNVFYMVRRPRSSTPICLVPLCVFGEPSMSCVALMVRKVRAHGETMWELVNVSEPLAYLDVKSLVLKLQERGLGDPAHFARDYELKTAAGRVGDGAAGGIEEDALTSSAQSSSSDLDISGSHRRLSDGLEQERSVTSVRASLSGERHYPQPPNRGGRSFSALLVDVPRVTREGRRQYNVGRSHFQTRLFDGDTSDEDEVLDDAMRAVVPCYTNASLVRYENGAYNVGSRVDNLVTHYVGHRETYALDAAAGQRALGGGRFGMSRDRLFPPLGAPRTRASAEWGTSLPVLDRCQLDGSEFAVRPELPADLLLTSQDRELGAGSQQHRSSFNGNPKKRQSAAGRVGRSSSFRGSGGHKSGKRLPSTRGGGKSGARTKKKAGGKKAASRSPESRVTNADAQRPSSSSSGRKLTAKKMQSRVSSAKSRAGSAKRK